MVFNFIFSNTLWSCRDIKRKRCTFTLFWTCWYIAIVLLNYRMTDRKPQSAAILFGWEVGVKNVVYNLGRDPDSCVSNINQDILFVLFQNNRPLSTRVYVDDWDDLTSSAIISCLTSFGFPAAVNMEGLWRMDGGDEHARSAYEPYNQVDEQIPNVPSNVTVMNCKLSWDKGLILHCHTAAEFVKQSTYPLKISSQSVSFQRFWKKLQCGVKEPYHLAHFFAKWYGLK